MHADVVSWGGVHPVFDSTRCCWLLAIGSPLCLVRPAGESAEWLNIVVEALWVREAASPRVARPPFPHWLSLRTTAPAAAKVAEILSPRSLLTSQAPPTAPPTPQVQIISPGIMAVAPVKVQDQLSHLVQSRDANKKDSSLPSWIKGFEVVGWSLGDRPPRIERTHVPRARGQLDTDTILDLDIVFEPSGFNLAIKAFMSSFLGLKSIPGLDLLPELFSEAARRTHPHLLVKVVDMQLRGTLRIRIRPEDQALFFAFAEPPQARPLRVRAGRFSLLQILRTLLP